ncbi:MAG: hypothetical protein ACLU9S_14930 [Oscillospiraceae bacterium]
MSRSMRRDLRRSIRKSAGRYLAILAIIALGSGFLVGLRSTKGDMMATAQTYIDKQALFDFRVLNTYGYSQEDVEALGQQPGIGAAEGAISMDVLLGGEDREEDAVFRLLNLPERINVPGYRPDECPNGQGNAWPTDSILPRGDIENLTLSQENEADARRLTVEEFTIVGLCSSPLFLNFERGSTTLGKGSLAAYLYVPEGAFDLGGVYTEIDLKLDRNYPMYDEEYERRLSETADALEPLAKTLAQARYETVVEEAETQLREGREAYEAGRKTYETQRDQAQEELQKAGAPAGPGGSGACRAKNWSGRTAKPPWRQARRRSMGATSG